MEMFLFQKTLLPDQSGLLSLLHIHARPRWASCQNTQWTQGRRLLRAGNGDACNSKRSQYLIIHCAWCRMCYHPTIMLFFCHIQPKYSWIQYLSMMVVVTASTNGWTAMPSNWYTWQLILISTPSASLFAPLINKETMVKEFHFIPVSRVTIYRGLKFQSCLFNFWSLNNIWFRKAHL